MVSIKILCYYWFMLKNRNKHVKNTQKLCFLHFFGSKFKNFKTKFVGSIAFFKSPC